MAMTQKENGAACAELKFWACFAVVFALLSQTLFPVQAMAAPGNGKTRFFLCMDTPDAAPAVDVATEKLISSHERSKRYQGLKCADCVLASITAIATPDQVTIPIRYTVTALALTVDPAKSSVRARAPPRPFSCGPPSEA